MAAVMTTHRPESRLAAPARPRLVLVGAPRAADRRSPRVAPATYRRRRVAAVVVALGIVVMAGKAGDALGGAPLAAPERRPPSTYVVRRGDSLWTVARRLAPHSDPRPVVDALHPRAARCAGAPGGDDRVGSVSRPLTA